MVIAKYSHFLDGETEGQLKNLAKVIHIVSGRAWL